MDRTVMMWVCLTLGGLVTGGCGDTAFTGRDGYPVKILYDENPIGGVEVRLYEKSRLSEGQPAYVGFSDRGGVALLAPVESDAPAIGAVQWTVALSSDGDGSWMLDPQWNDPAKSGLELTIAAGDDVPVLRLPQGAIRPLSR